MDIIGNEWFKDLGDFWFFNLITYFSVEIGLRPHKPNLSGVRVGADPVNKVATLEQISL